MDWIGWKGVGNRVGEIKIGVCSLNIGFIALNFNWSQTIAGDQIRQSKDLL